MEVVPDLRDPSTTGVGGVGASNSLVVARTAAADVWDSTVVLGQGTLDIANGVRGRIAGANAGLREPSPGW